MLVSSNVALLTPARRGLFVTAGAADDDDEVVPVVVGEDVSDDCDLWPSPSPPFGDTDGPTTTTPTGGTTTVAEATGSPTISVSLTTGAEIMDPAIPRPVGTSASANGDNGCDNVWAVAGFHDVTRTNCDKKRRLHEQQARRNMFA